MLKKMGNLELIYKIGSSTQDVVQENEAIPRTVLEREMDLRRRIENLARKCDSIFKYEFGTWNEKAMKQFGGKSRKDMGEKKLQEVLKWMENTAKEELARRRTECKTNR
jgi:hypothetical protein